jgi:hypothetical protein
MLSLPQGREEMGDRLCAVFLIGFGVFIWYLSRDYPPQSKLLPLLTMGVVINLILLVMVSPTPAGRFDHLLKLTSYCIITLITIVIMEKIGLFLSIGFLASAGLLIQGVKNIRTIFLTTFFTIIFIYLVFIKFFAIPLPTIFS